MEMYEALEMEVIRFDDNDVIVTSGDSSGCAAVTPCADF